MHGILFGISLRCPNCGGPVSAPPRPLQPGDKVLVECYYEASHAPGRGRVRFHAPVYQGHRMVSGDIVMGVPLSAIRPFPQEEV